MGATTMGSAKSIILLAVALFALLALTSAWRDPKGDRPIECGHPKGSFCCEAHRPMCCANGRNNCCSATHPVCCPDSDVCCPTDSPFCGKDGKCYQVPLRRWSTIGPPCENLGGHRTST